MGTADTVTKDYMRENSIFADAFNYLLYDGDAKIFPTHLRELDVTELALPYHTEDKHKISYGETIQKYRDILKSAVIKQDEAVAYILLGIENQTDIHYAMPVRNMIYDALQYSKQISGIAKAHQKDGTKKLNPKEYLSGFHRGDKLTPVITLVIHFGVDEWDGPLSLHEMMNIPDKRLLDFIQNYQIHLIDPAKLTAQDLERFSTSLREVLGYIKYSKNKKLLADFLTNSPRDSIEINAARVIQTLTRTPFKIQEGEEKIDMCEAIEEMINDGIAKGKAEGKIETLITLVNDGLLSLKEAAVRSNMTETDFQAAMENFLLRK